VEKINSIIHRFWWAGVQEDEVSNPIAYRSWEDICKPTEHGGLGIRDLETVNKSLIIHPAWNIATYKNPFLADILKAKYYPNESFWTTPDRGSRSIFWSSVLQVRHHLTSNSVYQIHAGNTSIWSAPWTPVWDHIHDHLLLPVHVPQCPCAACRKARDGSSVVRMRLLPHSPQSSPLPRPLSLQESDGRAILLGFAVPP